MTTDEKKIIKEKIVTELNHLHEQIGLLEELTQPIASDLFPRAVDPFRGNA